MRTRALQIKFQGATDIPERLETKPLFRYDDLAGGYQDGTVWRSGKTGRPLAIVTTELHLGMGTRERIVLTRALSTICGLFRRKYFNWSPHKAAVEMKPLSNVRKPVSSKNGRLLQLKQLAKRFKAVQIVNETVTVDQQLVLRLLPQNIDRYQPSENANADGAIFLFVAGRMPGVLLVLETDGVAWQFGVGRLSGPSKLMLSFDDKDVWAVGQALVIPMRGTLQPMVRRLCLASSEGECAES